MLEGVELWRVPLRLRRPVRSSAAWHDARPVIYVRVVTSAEEGWGECPALERGTAVDPRHDAVWRAMVDVVVPAFMRSAARDSAPAPCLASGAARAPDDPRRARDEIEAWIADLLPARAQKAQAWARAALEMALLDLALRRRGLALRTLLGTDRPVEVGAMVGIPASRSVEELVAAASALEARGYRRLRCKIAPGWDQVPLRAIRSCFPTLPLQADANGAYGAAADAVDAAARLEGLDELMLRCLEQPLAAGALRAHRELVRRLATPVALDESLWSAGRLREAIALGACSVACLKPARFGGVLEALRAWEACAGAGTAVFVGGMWETGLARSANGALAGGLAAEGWSPLPGDLGDPADYLDDPCGYPPVQAGLLELPEAPGVGPAPATSRLRALGATSRWIPAA